METPSDWEATNITKYVSEDKISSKHLKKFPTSSLVKSTRCSALEIAVFLLTKNNKFIFRASTHITVRYFLI